VSNGQLQQPTKKRIERLKDLEAVKWVIGKDRIDGNAVRLAADQIAEIGDIEMHQPWPYESSTWVNKNVNDKYLSVMAIVATESSELGASLVASGETDTFNQVAGLAIGCYATQQRRLRSQTGQCSEGCSLANVRLRTHRFVRGNTDVEQVCRHTLANCDSCQLMTTDKRAELLERLLINCRKMLDSASRIDGICEVELIVAELNGKVSSQ
jgi:hypothetical protein